MDPPRAGGGYFPRAGQTRTSLQRLRPGLPRARSPAAQRAKAPFGAEGPLSVRPDRWGGGGPAASCRPRGAHHIANIMKTGWMDGLRRATGGRMRRCRAAHGGGGSACITSAGGGSVHADIREGGRAVHAAHRSHPSLIDFFEWCARMIHGLQKWLPATSGGTY